MMNFCSYNWLIKLSVDFIITVATNVPLLQRDLALCPTCLLRVKRFVAQTVMQPMVSFWSSPMWSILCPSVAGDAFLFFLSCSIRISLNVSFSFAGCLRVYIFNQTFLVVTEKERERASFFVYCLSLCLSSEQERKRGRQTLRLFFVPGIALHDQKIFALSPHVSNVFKLVPKIKFLAVTKQTLFG